MLLARGTGRDVSYQSQAANWKMIAVECVLSSSVTHWRKRNNQIKTRGTPDNESYWNVANMQEKIG